MGRHARRGPQAMSQQSSLMPETRDRPLSKRLKDKKPWAVEHFWTKPWMNDPTTWRVWKRYETEEIAAKAAEGFARRYGSFMAFRVVERP